jgi:UDP-N-acetylglucosamine/UDP-N-acetylgalactosamine diphosphorylase
LRGVNERMTDIMNNVVQAEARLQLYKQEHILPYLRKLPADQQDRLAKQILKVNFDRLTESYRSIGRRKEDSLGILTPISHYEWNEDEKKVHEKRGWELLRQGKVGAIVVAGGQGSRLGHRGPKGTFDMGLPSGKSFFQLQAERLLNLSGRAGRSIPWYIMTSPDNHQDTVEFFSLRQYFGYRKEDCIFFEQRTMPAIDREGKLLMSSPSELNLAPSGNGECFASLRHSGALQDMENRGLKWLFYYNVDNALVKVADPAFIGLADIRNNPIATKVITKTGPEEKVGIVCMSSSRPAVVEYTEVPDPILRQRDSGGELAFGLGNLSMHMFSFDFISRYADEDIPYHAAFKKISCVDANGDVVEPETPNAYKLERLIFDFFPKIEEMTVVKVVREEEFAPVKNKEGDDSPLTARKLVLQLHKKWLEDAGRSTIGLADEDIEIPPLQSYSGEGL